METIVSCAKRGAGVVWIQSPAAREIIGAPSWYVVNIGESHVVIAQASSVTDLALSPKAQLTLIRLAELATGQQKLDLPGNLQHSEQNL